MSTSDSAPRWFGASVAGTAHKAAGRPCEDAWRGADVSTGTAVVVSDGVGSRRLAAESSVAVCESLLEVLMHPDARRFGGAEIGPRVSAAFTRRTAHLPSDDVGATCLYSWASGSGLIVGACGDGAVFVPDGDGAVRLQSESSGWRNETDIVGLGARWSYWEFASPSVVVLATDGIADDIRDGAEAELVQVVQETFVRLSEPDRTRCLARELDAWPTAWATDDLTMVVHLP